MSIGAPEGELNILGRKTWSGVRIYLCGPYPAELSLKHCPLLPAELGKAARPPPRRDGGNSSTTFLQSNMPIILARASLRTHSLKPHDCVEIKQRLFCGGPFGTQGLW